jgi:NitT/TauT family transport system substrate-binding protein
MRLNPRFFSLLIAGAALIGSAALALSASALDKPAAPASMIHVGALKGATGIGMIHLFDKPVVAKDGTAFDFAAVDTPDLMVSRLASGAIDVATLPPNLAAKLYSGKLPIRLLAVVGNGMLYLVSQDAAVKSFADLGGKEVYVAGVGATPEFLVKHFLSSEKYAAGNEPKLNFSLAYSEIASALVVGKVKYAVLPEPFVTLALKGNPALKVSIDLQAAWAAEFPGKAPYPMSVVVARTSVIQDKPQAMREFLAAYEDSIKAVNARPQEAGALVEKFDLGLKAPIVALAVPRLNYAFVAAPKARESLELLFGLFLAADPKSIGGALPDSGFYAGF